MSGKPKITRELPLQYCGIRSENSAGFYTLVDEAVRNGSVTNTRFSYDDGRTTSRVPECYRQLLAAYIERRKQEGCQRSTLYMASNACTRFLLFLQSRNITEVALISPAVVKDYLAQAEHRTVEGKNAYIYVARRFVRFLAEKNVHIYGKETARIRLKISLFSLVPLRIKIKHLPDHRLVGNPLLIR